MTLVLTSTQVVETSVTVTNYSNCSFQDYPHLDDHTKQSTVTPRFKPFTEYSGRSLVGWLNMPGIYCSPQSTETLHPSNEIVQTCSPSWW